MVADLRPVRRARIDLLGDHNYPVLRTSLPEAIVGDFTRLMAGIAPIDPTVTPDDLLRMLWRYGVVGLAQRLRIARGTAKAGNTINFRRMPEIRWGDGGPEPADE